MRILVTTSLAAAIATAGLASGWYSMAHAKDTPRLDPSSLVTQKSFDTGIYLVEFAEEGLVQHHRSQAARSNQPASKFDPQAAATQAYKNELMATQASHVARIKQQLGNVQVTHYYLASHSGIALKIETEEQLQALRALPFVRSVERDVEYELHTHRSATFTGANAIWDGSAGVAPSRGEGMVVAILDTGIDVNHPSFANDPSCGFSASFPKIKSYVSCTTTNASGACTGTDLVDSQGHGTHVASTAAGNVVTTTQDPTLNPEVGDQISGIAPCAQIRAYKTCATDSCAGSATQAGMNNAILAGDVDVSNYSIGGGNSPWSSGDSDRRKLDMIQAGILTVASAGNTRDATPNPIGLVSHLGPWVMTVASSTHDQQASNADLSAVGGPSNLQNVALNRASASPAFAGGVIELIRDPSNDDGCVPFSAGYFNNKAALIQRGTCNFTLKIEHAYNAGAELVLIRNNAAGAISMDTTGAPPVPAYSMLQAEGNALATFVDGNPGAEIDLEITRPDGDVLSSFSLRGPTSGNLANLTKPDITAPGDDVYAAYPGGYAWMGGTSMSGPQVAGGALLVRASQPTWTPTEVKSAMMMSASTTGSKDGVFGTPNTGPWDADDVGHGRMDLSKAVRAGLVMDETVANFLASNPSSSGNVRTLNLPSMRDVSCSPSCTWTRTVRNTLGTASSWSVSTDADDINITVSPTSFSFTGDVSETQVLTITASPNGSQTARTVFGTVNLTEAGDKSPDLHLTVAVRGTGVLTTPAIKVTPEALNAAAEVGDTAPISNVLRIENIGNQTLNWEQADDGTINFPEAVLIDQPQGGSSGIVSHFSTVIPGGANTAGDFNLTSQTSLTKIQALGFDNTSSMASVDSITFVIYPDANGKPSGSFEDGHIGAVWTYSTPPSGAGVQLAGTGTITLDLVAASQTLNLAPGHYWLTVYPTSNSSFATGAPRWNWFMADPAGSLGSMLIGTAFGAPNWAPTGSGGLGTATEDVAFNLSGTQTIQCGASWLSLGTTSGSVNQGQFMDVNVSVNPTGLAFGKHVAAICIDSNASNESFTVVPVTLTMSPSGTDMADVSLNATVTSPTTAGGNLTFTINAVNHGPANAENVEVLLTLPGDVSVSSVGQVSSRKYVGNQASPAIGSSWTCDTNVSPIVCEHAGPLSGAAEPLQLFGQVSPTAPEGVISASVSVQSTNPDPTPTNNSATLLITVQATALFADGFEAIPLVDSGAINQMVPAGGDKQWNFVTGQFGDYGAFTGADLNLYPGTGSLLTAYLFGDSVDGQGAVTTGPAGTLIAVLGSGAVIGPSTDFTSSGQNNMTAWHAGTTGYIGMRFLNETTGQFNYGYVELQTTGTTGFPATVTRYVYNPSGGSVTIP